MSTTNNTHGTDWYASGGFPVGTFAGSCPLPSMDELRKQAEET